MTDEWDDPPGVDETTTDPPAVPPFTYGVAFSIGIAVLLIGFFNADRMLQVAALTMIAALAMARTVALSLEGRST